MGERAGGGTSRSVLCVRSPSFVSTSVSRSIIKITHSHDNASMVAKDLLAPLLVERVSHA